VGFKQLSCSLHGKTKYRQNKHPETTYKTIIRKAAWWPAESLSGVKNKAINPPEA
jgi:hypothetical protein